MANFMKLMKQAASMQKDMERVQGELVEKTVEFSAGGGMVTATARGDGTLAGLKINPQVVNPAEVDMLEDLVTAAVDGALKAAKEMAAKELGKITAGLNIPGLG
ncbi:MAG: YbaB/EbfC family nucleoid-associated protein [Verrucomicrobia bacterium]|nr:MAG: YbaB/EbfC family nucleoid-associated protein [Verrucomicrobiota bacterium]